jgi:hypothetical protein
MGNLPADAITIETAGLTCPPEMFPKRRMTKVNAAPIAMGFPVAKIM